MDSSAGDGCDGARDRAWMAPSSPAERLLEESPFEVSRRFTPRERMAEGSLAALFLIAAAAMVLALPADGTVPAGPAIALTLAYALASRVTFNVGAGIAVPTQVLLVPMLFVLPAPAVPLFVAAALALGAVPDLLTRRANSERLLSAIVDAWHAVGPALVLALTTSTTPSLRNWPVLIVALAAQFAADLVASSTREALGRGIAPRLQLGVLAWVYLADLLLAPAGLAAAWMARSEPYAAILGLALVGLLALLARERTARIRQALALVRANRESALALGERVDELHRERARVEAAIKRIGQALSSSLDRAELLDLVLQTAADALGAEYGRLRTRTEDDDASLDEDVRLGDREGLEPVMATVEATALRDGRTAQLQQRDAYAVACLLQASRGPRSVVTLCRRGRPFTRGERDLLEHLVRQAATSIDNIALHEAVQRQARTDELTGLSNHRRLHDFLAVEIERSARTGLPLGLVMVDIDHFKRVNDNYGHQAGDLVLRNVARLIAANCRAGDEPARYGGEELVLALPDTTLEAAYEVAERLRGTIEAFETPFDGHGLQVTASLGVAAVTGETGGVADLIAAADAALYQAKRGGRNRTVRSHAAPRAASIRR